MTDVDGRSRSGSHTRERLLRAAVVVGARDGWGGVTTRAVAAEAGVAPGLVHYHVGSVAALRRDALGHALAGVADVATAGLADARDAATAVAAMVAPVAGSGPHDPTVTYVHEAFLASARDDEVRTLLAGALGEFRSAVAAWVDARTADVPGRPDPGAVATVLAAVVDGLYLHRLLDERVDVDGVVGPLARLADGGAR